MSRIVLGITGGVAAFKAVALASRLRQAGHQVDAILTPGAEAFLTPLSLSAVTGRRAYTDRDMFAAQDDILHVELAQAAELVIVVPATADFLARAANGLADSLLAATLLSTSAKVLWAPAMETGMWHHPATQQNVAALEGMGHVLVGPAKGHLASGRSGAGRMVEPEEIAREAARLLTSGRLSGLRVLVTAGPTREYIDPVRFLSNPSTGRMGVAVAQAARDQGAQVTLVLGPTEVRAPQGVETVRVTSAQDMFETVQDRFGASEVLVATAAVADLRPAERLLQKAKKAQLPTELRLVRTQDILAWAGGHRRPDQVLVGFAAETSDPGSEARRKLDEKHCDLVVANDVLATGAGFAVETNTCLFVTATGTRPVGPATKRQIGEEIMAFVCQRLGR